MRSFSSISRSIAVSYVKTSSNGLQTLSSSLAPPSPIIPANARVCGATTGFYGCINAEKSSSTAVLPCIDACRRFWRGFWRRRRCRWLFGRRCCCRAISRRQRRKRYHCRRRSGRRRWRDIDERDDALALETGGCRSRTRCCCAAVEAAKDEQEEEAKRHFRFHWSLLTLPCMKSDGWFI